MARSERSWRCRHLHREAGKRDLVTAKKAFPYGQKKRNKEKKKAPPLWRGDDPDRSGLENPEGGSEATGEAFRLPRGGLLVTQGRENSLIIRGAFARAGGGREYARWERRNVDHAAQARRRRGASLVGGDVLLAGPARDVEEKKTVTS